MKSPHVTPRFEAGGGATLLVEAQRGLPLVSIVVALRSGSAFDPIGKEGLARIVGRMLRRGCEGMDAMAIEGAIDRLGGELSIDLSASTLAFQAQVIGRSVDRFVDLVARVLGSPTFNEDELSRLLRETSAEIAESRDNDRSLASHFFKRAVFGGHAYGRTSLGTVAGLARITGDDVRAFYAKHFTRANVVVGFSGDVTEERARLLAERLLRALPAGEAVADIVGAPVARPGRRLVIVDKPERTQTQLMIGGMGTWGHDEDHVALGVANAIFGGTFTSRLMKAVRSERGWSYGAYARLSLDRQRQAFSMWTFPAATDAAPCVALELEMLEAWIDKGVTREEVDFIAQYLIRSQAFEVDTSSKRLHQAIDIELLGLPDDYHSAYAARVAEVTPETANEAVRRRISARDLVVTLVGTADELRAPMEAAIAGLGATDVIPFDTEE